MLNEKQNEVLAILQRLQRQIRSEADDDYERDVIIMAIEDDIMAKLEVANTKQDGFLVLLQALKDNQNNPAKLQAIAKSIDEQQADWEAAFAANTPPVEPPPVEPPPIVPSGN